MRYVYLLKSLAHPAQRYTGSTVDLKARLELHNRCQVRHTAKHAPWELHVAIRFVDDQRAVDFER